jgi:predicted metal-dependent phosphoesterase TrpH
VTAAASGRLGPARVIVGEEIRTQAGEVIGMFLTERVPYVLPAAEAIRLIRAQGGLVYLPHPHDMARGSVGAAADRLCADGMADIVEVFNAKIADQSLNARAADLAARWGLPGGAGMRAWSGSTGPTPRASSRHSRLKHAGDPSRPAGQ